MKPLNHTDKYKLIQGDCLSVLREMDKESVNCVITSPPYWGMRAYDNEDDSREIGNENTFEQYVSNLTVIFEEARRVLKDDGSLWLNLGDKYVDKALLGMPWRVAISLMNNGWIMRNDVIWHLFGYNDYPDTYVQKSKKYYYNADAILIKPSKLPTISNSNTVSSTGVSGKKYRRLIQESTYLTEQEKINALKALDDTLAEIRAGLVNDFRMTIRGAQRAWHSDNAKISGRAKELVNRGYYIMKIHAKGHLPSDVWNIVTEDTWRKDSHCAVYPEELLRIPILATCPEDGIVLDPFNGTGTTVVASLKFGRCAIGIDLSPTYIKTAQERIDNLGFLF